MQHRPAATCKNNYIVNTKTFIIILPDSLRKHEILHRIVFGAMHVEQRKYVSLKLLPMTDRRKVSFFGQLLIYTICSQRQMSQSRDWRTSARIVQQKQTHCIYKKQPRHSVAVVLTCSYWST